MKTPADHGLMSIERNRRKPWLWRIQPGKDVKSPDDLQEFAAYVSGELLHLPCQQFAQEGESTFRAFVKPV